MWTSSATSHQLFTRDASDTTVSVDSFMAADPRPTIAGGIAAAAITACLYAAHSAAFSSTLSRPSAPIYLHHQGAGTTLSFIPSTGLFIASNMSTPARFRLVDVSRALVRGLYEQQRQAEILATRVGLGGVKATTRSGCACSGFSNEFGFGRYCHPWEDPYQDAWCATKHPTPSVETP